MPLIGTEDLNEMKVRFAKGDFENPMGCLSAFFNAKIVLSVCSKTLFLTRSEGDSCLSTDARNSWFKPKIFEVRFV